MPNGKVLYFKRTQVSVLPNFAMTDFSSQGRTRLANVCDLTNCRNYQSVYTCLLRGSTYNGTLIMQGFDANTLPVSGGISGELRQEFRDLEMLDEITTMIYTHSLPSNIYGNTRNALIHSYRSCKGKDCVPSKVHTLLTWSKTDEYDVVEVTENTRYLYLDKKQKETSDTMTDNN